jgi:bifunctional ADP-heptose synthase (sugar kinase/adenylyltransferase)
VATRGFSIRRVLVDPKNADFARHRGATVSVSESRETPRALNLDARDLTLRLDAADIPVQDLDPEFHTATLGEKESHWCGGVIAFCPRLWRARSSTSLTPEIR